MLVLLLLLLLLLIPFSSSVSFSIIFRDRVR